MGEGETSGSALLTSERVTPRWTRALDPRTWGAGVPGEGRWHQRLRAGFGALLVIGWVVWIATAWMTAPRWVDVDQALDDAASGHVVTALVADAHHDSDGFLWTTVLPSARDFQVSEGASGVVYRLDDGGVRAST